MALTLSGRIKAEEVAELQGLFKHCERKGDHHGKI
jgi:hypothetical protein